ncbi:DUF5991 domain-containing protein [Sphingomonas sp. TZW2008]|uniref:DUF5991 domain-containing protein n=1 Tax=Sphingomonas sp. TZW2008 TaxID=1917973 RepID=UPI000A26961D|nr:DUF5991 domain-containing protein [Sphingomonas sp. TZW2008]
MLKSIMTVAALGAATLPVAGPAIAAPLSTWHGTFVWEEPLGRVGGAGADGVAIFVTHTLTLGPAAGSTGCRLDAQGYQTDLHVKCTATPEMDSVVIKLYKFRPTDPGRGPSGTRLFRMTRTENGLMTRLESYGPTSDMGSRSGPLFRRAG